MGQWADTPGELGSIISAYKRFDVPGEIGNLPAPAGLAYIVITVTAASTADSALPLNLSHFFLEDAAGRRWQPTVYFGDIGPKTSLPAHRTAQGDLYFLVPNLPYSGSKVFWALMGDPFKWTEWQLPF
jgi:hypothetical protein